MNNYKIEDHIGIFPNSMPEKICKDYINYYEEINEVARHPRYKHQQHQISDKSTDIYSNIFDYGISIKYINTKASEIIWSKYDLYVKKYSYLNELQKHTIVDLKLQKTEVGQGYHTWHCESAGLMHKQRLLAFMIYLNDVDEGGETEFLYQHKRTKAETGKLLIWPAQFTHVHRGNMPISNTKYILTGWIEYIN